jgi:hypothetical protein
MKLYAWGISALLTISLALSGWTLKTVVDQGQDVAAIKQDTQNINSKINDNALELVRHSNQLMDLNRRLSIIEGRLSNDD